MWHMCVDVYIFVCCTHTRVCGLCLSRGKACVGWKCVLVFYLQHWRYRNIQPSLIWQQSLSNNNNNNKSQLREHSLTNGGIRFCGLIATLYLYLPIMCLKCIQFGVDYWLWRKGLLSRVMLEIILQEKRPTCWGKWAYFIQLLSINHSCL